MLKNNFSNKLFIGGIIFLFFVSTLSGTSLIGSSINDPALEKVIVPSINVTKSANPIQAMWGADIDFTITITNTGSETLNPVILHDNLPEGMSYMTATPLPNSIDNTTLIWNDLGPLDSADYIIINLTAHIEYGAPRFLHNAVNVTGYTSWDSVEDENAADVEVLSPVEVIKSVHYNCNGPWNDTGIVIDFEEIPYDWCTFRINVTNLVDVSLDVTICDVFPEGLINGEHYYPRFPDYIDGNSMYWYFDGANDEFLQPGMTKTIVIEAEMGACDEVYTNLASVLSQYGTSNPYENNDTAFVQWINCPTSGIDINQSVCDRGFPIRNADDGTWGGAQSFKPTNPILNMIEIYIEKFGSPDFDLVVELREEDIHGSLIETFTFSPEEIPDTWEWIPLDCDALLVSTEMQYIIVIPPPSGVILDSFGYEWGYANGDLYSDGSFWFTRDGGSVWRALPDLYEFTFKTYSDL